MLYMILLVGVSYIAAALPVFPDLSDIVNICMQVLFCDLIVWDFNIMGEAVQKLKLNPVYYVAQGNSTFLSIRSFSGKLQAGLYYWVSASDSSPSWK